MQLMAAQSWYAMPKSEHPNERVPDPTKKNW